MRLGAATPQWEALKRESAYTGRIVELNRLAEDQLRQLYHLVDCLLFPSWYEGFGWPPLEAMACGTPAVISNSGSLPEVAGTSAIVVAPDDVTGLAQGVESVLEDEAVRKRLVEAGMEHVKKYSWDKTARRLLEIYQEMR